MQHWREGGVERSEADAPTLSLRGIEHRYSSRAVFAGIDLDLDVGQVGVVTGANGSGKSTFLKIIAGLLTPTAGKVDVRIGDVSLDSQQRRRYIGYVAPDLALYRELTGVENLSFFARLRGIEPTRALLKAALEQVGLLGRGSDLTGDYSSGMRQRLKYAFALLGDPPILLLDEPTANLDTSGVEMVERIIAMQRSRAGGGLALIGTNEPREEAWGDIRLRLSGTE